MKIADVPWSELRVGQVVAISSVSDDFRGKIVKLERDPMVWISWDDGNHSEYTKAIIGHVDLIDEIVKVGAFDSDQVLADREFVDTEGE